MVIFLIQSVLFLISYDAPIRAQQIFTLLFTNLQNAELVPQWSLNLANEIIFFIILRTGDLHICMFNLFHSFFPVFKFSYFGSQESHFRSWEPHHVAHMSFDRTRVVFNSFVDSWHKMSQAHLVWFLLKSWFSCFLQRALRIGIWTQAI